MTEATFKALMQRKENKPRQKHRLNVRRVEKPRENRVNTITLEIFCDKSQTLIQNREKEPEQTWSDFRMALRGGRYRPGEI